MIHTIDLQFLGISQTIAAYVIDTSVGPVLVETGPHSTLPQLEAGLDKLGYQSSAIQHVFLTHIHLDHAGAAWYFARQGATIYVHPFGARHLKQPEKLMNSAKRIYQDQMDRLWGQMNPIPEERIVEVPHEAVFKVGDREFISHYTPGHAVHHIAWQVGRDLFTGDVAGIRIDEGPVVPPCPPPDINVEDWQASLKLIRALAPDRLWLTHFGPSESYDVHLQELEHRLLDWAGWMRPHYEAGKSIEEVTPLFANYVKGQLQQTSLNEQAIAQYEAANPFWMSVAGLLRYWKKKLEA